MGKTLTAYKYGERAFFEFLSRIPLRDKEFVEVWLNDGLDNSTKFFSMEEWLRGWDGASRAYFKAEKDMEEKKRNSTKKSSKMNPKGMW